MDGIIEPQLLLLAGLDDLLPQETGLAIVDSAAEFCNRGLPVIGSPRKFGKPNLEALIPKNMGREYKRVFKEIICTDQLDDINLAEEIKRLLHAKNIIVDRGINIKVGGMGFAFDGEFISDYFTPKDDAVYGVWRGCIPLACATYNLTSYGRSSQLSFFVDPSIAWDKGHLGHNSLYRYLGTIERKQVFKMEEGLSFLF